MIPLWAIYCFNNVLYPFCLYFDVLFNPMGPLHFPILYSNFIFLSVCIKPWSDEDYIQNNRNISPNTVTCGY